MIGTKLNLRPSYFDLARQVLTVLDEQLGLGARHLPVIGVGGESGSGKSVMAACLMVELGNRGQRAMLLAQDDYFWLPPRDNHAKRLKDFGNVGPQEIRMERLAADIEAFRDQTVVEDAPLVDYAANQIHTHVLDFREADILLVEGTYVLEMDGLDLRIFMSRTFRDTRPQRHARLRDANDLDPAMETILEIEHTMIKPHSARADVVIGHDYTVSTQGFSSSAF